MVAGLSRSTVIEAVKALEVKGLVRVFRDVVLDDDGKVKGKGGRARVNRYRLTVNGKDGSF